MGFKFSLFTLMKVACVDCLSLSLSSPPPHPSLCPTPFSPLSLWSPPLPPPPPPPLFLVVCQVAHGGQQKDKLTNWKLVQQKVRGRRSADSMSYGKSRATGQWLHSSEIYTPLSFYRSARIFFFNLEPWGNIS